VFSENSGFGAPVESRVARPFASVDARRDASEARAGLGYRHDVTTRQPTPPSSSQAPDAALTMAREHISRWDSETKYKTLFDSIDEGFCVIKVVRGECGQASDYVFLETNPSFDRQTGLVGAVGQSMRALAPTHEEHWFQTYGEVARTGVPVRFEAPANALARWYDVYAFRVGEPGQDLVGVLFNDITRRKDLESAIERQNEMLRKADARKDQFLATLSHELRNPLAPIRSGLRIIKLLGPDDERLQHTLEMMERQTSHLVRLVDDLMEVSRITRGKIELRSGRVLLGSALSAAVEAVWPHMEAKRIELVQDAAAVVPVEGDRDRLTQVFSNLLSNATKFTDAGGRISIDLRRDGDEAVVTVSDTGCGIEPDAIDAVFEMFWQAPSEEPRGGLGIGLALARELVQMHGGTLTVQSAGRRHGSQFTVRLPASPGVEVTRVGDRPKGLAETEQMRRKILVVDDNADAADSLALTLRLQGHVVEVAYDGDSALETSQRLSPEVVILDIGMAGMDGYEVARQLRRGQPQTRLIALTGWGQENDKVRAREAGFDWHLTKPADPETLHAILLG
jgi:signal transduction histidine kinase